MPDPSLTERVAAVILREGGGPGNSIHSWRCEYPDRYGPCTCVAELAAMIVAELTAQGRASVRVEEER